MKKMIAAAAFALCATPSFAALSGYYDSAEQISTILQSEELGNRLRQMPIETIEFEGIRRDGTHEWEVEGRDCDVTVILTPSGPGRAADGTPMVGKTTYEVTDVGPCR